MSLVYDFKDFMVCLHFWSANVKLFEAIRGWAMELDVASFTVREVELGLEMASNAGCKS